MVQMDGEVHLDNLMNAELRAMKDKNRLWKKKLKIYLKKKSTQSTEHLFFFLKKNNNTFLVCLFVNVCAFAQLTYWPFFFRNLDRIV